MKNQPNLRYHLDVMGISLWTRRHLPPTVTNDNITPTAIECVSNAMTAEPSFPEEIPPSDVTPTPVVLTEETSIPLLDWGALQKRVAACTACGLEKTRTQTVFGVGNRQATWMIVGEAPGADEDAQGEPFVGRAGQLLNAMLHAIKLSRETVYIANVLKCRPPDNRNPTREEMVCCTPFLRRQIDLIRPKIILAVGSIAACYLLSTDAQIGKLRGKCFTYADTDIPLIATYHPAYLLRRPSEKRKAWQDLQLALETLTEATKNPA